jgi:cyclophilin family peptidyl-prolyl cis-trans isomerase/HEAT repeat protein
VKGFLITIASLLAWSCSTKDSTNRFTDNILVRIADAQDRRLTDSLYRYLQAPDSTYRAAAALAFASVRDSAASPSLGNLLLEDPSAKVRQNAAFALGQTPCIASGNALIAALTDGNRFVVREVLEALGKTIRKNDLDQIINYNPVDSVTREGLSWAYYRLGVRGLADSVITDRVSGFLNPANPYSTRLAAAHFFNRAATPGNHFEKRLIEAARHDPSADVRIAATAGLRKFKGNEVEQALRSISRVEKDYRVRVAAVRALAAVGLPGAKSFLMECLHDSNASVGIATAEAIVSSLKEPWPELLEEARRASQWRIQANLYKVVLIFSPAAEVRDEIIARFKSSKNNYQKAALLNSLAASDEAFPFIRDQLLAGNAFVIESSAAEGLTTIDRRKKYSEAHRAEFVAAYQRAIAAGDPAVTGIVCQALSDPALGYKKVLRNLDFLYQAKKRMTVPRDIESLQPLEEAIAFFEGKEKPAVLKNGFNHPIEWSRVAAIRGNQRVQIVTTKGTLVLRLLVNEAPGSVANFIDLVNRNYFDGKFFHRVVPNFVIQAGCPRGDGFGSENYSIRSEFSGRRYAAGAVGMASAGKDTEGTQWFITHSPTPHLEGNYTLFAEVERGMDVAHGIEVGDQILTATLIGN